MFKSIKEFFVGKPKVEETPVDITLPVVEEINPETVVITISDDMNMSYSTQPDTIIFPRPEDSDAWPFPKVVPPESEVKKKRTLVKREEPVTKKKPTSAIKANNKPRKKK